jgi:hypothetical protein
MMVMGSDNVLKHSFRPDHSDNPETLLKNYGFELFDMPAGIDCLQVNSFCFARFPFSA